VIGDLGHAKIIEVPRHHIPESPSDPVENNDGGIISSLRSVFNRLVHGEGAGGTSDFDTAGVFTVQNIGSPGFNSPELKRAQNMGLKASFYDLEKNDVWSLGSTVFTLVGAVNIWTNVAGISRDDLDKNLTPEDRHVDILLFFERSF